MPSLGIRVRLASRSRREYRVNEVRKLLHSNELALEARPSLTDLLQSSSSNKSLALGVLWLSNVDCVFQIISPHRDVLFRHALELTTLFSRQLAHDFGRGSKDE